MEAAKVVIHAYPKYQNVEPLEYVYPSFSAPHVLISRSYTRGCELLMPQLERLLSSMTQSQIIPLLDQTYLMKLAEVGLSASNFRDQTWKERVVAVAAEPLMPQARWRLPSPTRPCTWSWLASERHT